MRQRSVCGSANTSRALTGRLFVVEQVVAAVNVELGLKPEAEIELNVVAVY